MVERGPFTGRDVFETIYALRNGGNTPEKRREAIKLINSDGKIKSLTYAYRLLLNLVVRG